MAISLKTAGTWARMVTDNGTVTIPGTPAAGDRMFLFGAWKDFAITVADPSGWTPIGTVFADGSTNAGNGTGSVSVMAWYRNWQSGDSAPAIDYSSAPTEGHWVIQLWTKAGGDTWGTPSTVTGAIAAADPFTVDASSTATIPNASVVMGLVAFRDDSTAMTRATDAIDDTGALVTWNGNYVESPATHFNSTTGLDMAGDLGHRFVTTGAAGVTLHMDGDITAAESGSAKWVIQGLFVSDPKTATPSTASLATSTFAPTVTATNHKTATPATASLTTAAFAPTVSAPRLATPTTSSLTLTAFEPTVTALSGTTVTPDTASLSTSTFAPTVTATAHQTVTPSTASVVTAAFAPTISVTDHQLVTPGTASVALTAFVPTVVATDPKLVTPSTASLSLTAFAPAANAGQSATPGTATLTLTTFAPDAVLTDNQLVTPGTATLVLASFAASVSAPQSVTPATVALALSAFAPSVEVHGAGEVQPGPASLSLTAHNPSVLIAYRGITAGLVSAGSLSASVAGSGFGGTIVSQGAPVQIDLTETD